MTTSNVSITATIDGRQVARDEVLDWEKARLSKAAKKLGVPSPAGNLSQAREEFCDLKLRLGADDIRRRLARDIRLSDTTALFTSRGSRGKRSTSVCDLHVYGGNAQQFVNWFSDIERDDYARSMVLANPDHFVIDTAPDGSQEVIETTGGSPLATRFFVDYEDTTPLVTPYDESFPLELAGVARTEKGLAIGGVRHQLRDQPDGFHIRTRVEFPRLMVRHMLNEHRWHLACEFSNWIEAAFTK